MRDESLPPILPAGTQVVTAVDGPGASGGVPPPGTMGVVVRSPADPWRAYRVRFADGFEASFKRQELTVLSQFQSGDLGGPGPTAGADFDEFVIYRCVMGSRAYGLDDAASDTDRRGIYLPPAERQWSLQGVPEQIEKDATQEVYWELQKFLTLALKANPNVLECLYTPLIEHAGPVAERLLAMRSAFLSRLVYPTYNGYVMSQSKKLKSDLRQHGQAKPKHSMHLIRLLLAGIATLREGVVPVHVGEHRDRLLAVKRGEMALDEVEVWRQVLHRQFDAAFESTTLPERPDYAAVNALLIDARRGMVRS